MIVHRVQVRTYLHECTHEVCTCMYVHALCICMHTQHIRTHTMYVCIHHAIMDFLSLLCALRLSLLAAELNFSKHLPLQQIVAEKGDRITAMKAQQAVGRLKREEALLSNYVSKTKALERCVYSPV